MTRTRPTSPRIPPIEHLADRIREKTAGGVVQAINMGATLGTNRKVAKAMSAVSDVLLHQGSIPPRLRELVILRMGWNCSCVYEFGQHTLYALSVGLTPDDVRLTTRPIDEGQWSDVERAVLQMTDDLFADDCVTDTTWADLEGHFDHSQIIEFLCAATCYRMGCAMFNSCGVQREPGVPGWPT
ncbi:MAG TPA: carboxymuconolactone decarboxylase family protein [Acidimicrobiales bacterium]|jgi:alkylhydroperoxidase family enzyme